MAFHQVRAGSDNLTPRGRRSITLGSCGKAKYLGTIKSCIRFKQRRVKLISPQVSFQQLLTNNCSCILIQVQLHIFTHSSKMRSSTVVALFAGSVAAQSTAVVVNPLMPAETLTVIGSSEGTTTYVNSCSDGGIPASYLTPGTLFPMPDIQSCIDS